MSKSDNNVLLAYGYIKQCYKEFDSSLLFLSDDIINLLAVWILLNDTFSNTNKSPLIVVSNDMDAEDQMSGIYQIARKTTKYPSTAEHVFGSNIFSKGHLIKWRFKYKKHWASQIGIIQQENMHKVSQGSDYLSTSIGGDGYGLFTLDGGSYHKDKCLGKMLPAKITHDDIIEMELDLTSTKQEEGILSYTLNGKPGAPLFNHVDIDKKWVMALTLYGDDCVALIQ